MAASISAQPAACEARASSDIDIEVRRSGIGSDIAAWLWSAELVPFAASAIHAAALIQSIGTRTCKRS